MISTFDITRDELLARVNELNLRARASINLSRRMIDQSFLLLNDIHRNRYALRPAEGLMKANCKPVPPEAATGQLKADRAKTEAYVTLDAGYTAAKTMCDRCDGSFFDHMTYRVRSEESGLVMLNMTVCYACKLEAENLGLKTEEVREIDPR